jgi:pilus assembly protein CpaB
LALLIALVISVGITYIFYVRVVRQQAAARPKTKKVIGAAAALQPGTPITADNLVQIDWPENIPLEGLIENRDDVVGRVLVYPVGNKEPVLKRDIASNVAFGLAAKIPDGMRAMAIKTNEVSNVAGFLFPGARVDVLVTLRGDNNVTLTRTVLQNVQVLTTGSKIEADPQGKPENVNVITLLLTPEESGKLVLAQNQGSIQFVLRNGADTAQTEIPPVDMALLTGAPRKPVQSEVKHRGTAATPVKPTVYTVETVAGNKVTVTKFGVRPE